MYRTIYHTIHGTMVGSMKGSIEEAVALCKDQMKTMPELNRVEICTVVTTVDQGSA